MILDSAGIGSRISFTLQGVKVTKSAIFVSFSGVVNLSGVAFGTTDGEMDFYNMRAGININNCLIKMVQSRH